MPGEQERFGELIERLNSSDDLSTQVIEDLIGDIRIEDIAEIFPHLREPVKSHLFDSLGEEDAAELLAELDEIAVIQILKDLDPDRIASICNYLPPDEGADVIGFSDEEDQPEILEQMDQDLADKIQSLATYSPETAGGVMTSEFMAVRNDKSVRSILLRVKTSEMEEAIQNVYVQDNKDELVGVASLRDLLQADLNQKVDEIMERDVISVPLDMDQEEVSRIVNRYDFTAVPVVNEVGILMGIVTFDDVMDVMEEESSEDMYRMAGEVTMHPTQQHFVRRVSARMPWLLVTLGGTYLAAMLIKWFETSSGLNDAHVENLWTLLLCFIPMIGGMAGNVGIQSSTVMVRGLATGEVYPSIFWKVLTKEVFIASIIGLISGTIIGGVLILFPPDSGHYDAGNLGYVVSLALFGSIVCAAFLGTMMPFACLLIKVDPAYASGPILTTLNDLFGFAIYFTIALPLLH